MNRSDYKKFTDEWHLSQEIGVNGKVLSKSAMDAVFEMFLDYPLAAVLHAFSKHREQGRFAPTPHDLLKILNSGRPEHLDAEEAWAIALQSMDEDETVILTSEIMQARAIAWVVFDSGDEVGARMAFKQAYKRIIESAPPPKWVVSLGYDASRRDDAIRSAVEMGRLPRHVAQQYLPETPAINKNSKVVQLFGELKTKLDTSQDENKAAQVREAKRQAFEQHRETELRKIADRLKGDE